MHSSNNNNSSSNSNNNKNIYVYIIIWIWINKSRKTYLFGQCGQHFYACDRVLHRTERATWMNHLVRISRLYNVHFCVRKQTVTKWRRRRRRQQLEWSKLGKKKKYEETTREKKDQPHWKYNWILPQIWRLQLLCFHVQFFFFYFSCVNTFIWAAHFAWYFFISLALIISFHLNSKYDSRRNFDSVECISVNSATS